MELHLKKNEAAELFFPMVDSASPASFKTGVSVVDTAYYEDGGGWSSLAISDTVTEIASTGMYQLDLTAAELNHDRIIIKLSVSGTADSAILVRTFAVDIDDVVRSTTPANTLDVEAGGTAGINWANVANQGTSVDLSATAIDLCDDVTTTVNLTTNNDKTGYTASTVSDKTGYSIADTTSDAVIAGAVWDALTSGYGIADSYGALLEAGAGGLTAAQVWDYDISGVVTANFAGTILNNVPNTSEFEARTIVAGNYFDAATDTVVNVTNVATLNELGTSAIADLFLNDSGTTYASAVSGSAVKEIADNAGGSSLTVADIVDGVWDEPIADHTNPVQFGGKNQKVVPSETINDYKATGFSTHSAANVWAVGTRALTDKTNFSLDADQSGVTIGTVTTSTDMRGTDNAFLATNAPTNFSDLAVTVSTGKVTVGTNDDKTGYTVSTVSDKTGYALVADSSAVTIGTVNTLTGHTAQTADHTTGIAAIPTVAEFEARTILAANYFDPAADAVANVTLTATTTDVTNGVTVTTNSDKTGYSISGALTTLDALENITTAEVNTEVDNSMLTYGLDHLVSASVVGVDVVDNSIFAKLVSKADGAADWDTFDWTTDSLEALADGGGGGITAAQVWDYDISGVVGAGYAGTILNDAPSTSEFEARTRADADYFSWGSDEVIVTTNNDKTGYSIADGTSDAVIAGAIWDAQTSGYGVGGSYGEKVESLSAGGDATATNQTTIINYVDTLETRLTAARAGHLDNLNGHTAQTGDSYGIVNSGSFGNAVLVRSTTPNNPLTVDGTGKVDVDTCTTNSDMITTAQVNTEVDTALTDIGLDHLLGVSVTGTDVANDSIIAKMVSKAATSDWDTYVNTTDSMEAVRDRGDAEWVTAAGFSTHSAVNVRTEMDSNSTKLSDIVGDTNELQGDLTNGGRLDLLIDAIKAETDQISSASSLADGDTPTTSSLAWGLRQCKWFAANEWRIDEAPATDTLIIYQGDNVTPGLSFTVYSSSQVTYRDPV